MATVRLSERSVGMLKPRKSAYDVRDRELKGYRPEGSNPCVSIKRYRRQGRERFLSAAEISRLGEVLARHEADQPQAVAIVRLMNDQCREFDRVAPRRRTIHIERSRMR